MTKNGTLLAYFGHHKAASDWIRKISYDVCEHVGLKYVYVHHPRQFDAHLPSFVQRENIDFLSHANADIEHVRGMISEIRGFHVVRDPRDIIVSAYFSHLYSHPPEGFPRLVAHRDRLRRLSKEEGLLAEMEFLHQSFDSMARWDYSLPNVLELKMEQLIREPGQHFCRIYDFLGMMENGPSGSGGALTRQKVLDVVEKYRFEKQAGGRTPGQEDPHSHYRKGVPGDWKNHFTEQHKRELKKSWNGLLIKLGYEKDGSW